MDSRMWQGVKDGGREERVFGFRVGRFTVQLRRQYTGDCYGRIGGDSWVLRLVITRDP